jgi:hypothetical protein
MNLGEIEQLTKEFSEARQQLADRVRGLEDEIQTIKRRRLTGIKNTVNIVIEKQSHLKAAVEESSALFVKPRTMVLHGIKIGFQKEKGKISWTDNDQVIKLIKKHLPEQADVLIKTTEKPVKDALLNLPTADLKKIGCTVSETGDQVVIKSTDSEIDKFVDTLLKEEGLDKSEEAV